MVEMALWTGDPNEPSTVGSGLDYYAEGALLEGVDQLSPAEADARLTELGICHDFSSGPPTSSATQREIRGHFGYAERWCTVPPFVRQRDYGDRGPRLYGPGGTVSRFPFGTGREGYVTIYIEDEKPRKRRPQPPAGWNCPTH